MNFTSIGFNIERLNFATVKSILYWSIIQGENFEKILTNIILKKYNQCSFKQSYYYLLFACVEKYMYKCIWKIIICFIIIICYTCFDPVAIYASRNAENNKNAFLMISSSDRCLLILGIDVKYAFMKKRSIFTAMLH